MRFNSKWEFVAGKETRFQAPRSFLSKRGDALSWQGIPFYKNDNLTDTLMCSALFYVLHTPSLIQYSQQCYGVGTVTIPMLKVRDSYEEVK